MANQAQPGFRDLFLDPGFLLPVAAGIRQALAPLQQHLPQGFAQARDLDLALGAQVFLLHLLDLLPQAVVLLAGLFQDPGHLLELFTQLRIIPGQ